MKMKTGLLASLLVLVLLLILFAAFPALGQTTRQNARTYNYYFGIGRPNCCEIPRQEWQKIAANLKRQGIPAFFGTYEAIGDEENWQLVRLRQPAPKDGWLMVGPFASAESAVRTIRRLPKLLPRYYGEPFAELEAGDSQRWDIGMYQIRGFKTAASVSSRAQKR